MISDFKINNENIRKGNKVMKTLTTIPYPNLNNYVMFEDNWICGCDKTLYDDKGNAFSVLDFKEIEINTPINPQAMPYFNG